MATDPAYIQSLKTYMIAQLRKLIPGVHFNGDVEGKSLYTVLNVSFPKTERDTQLSESSSFPEREG